MTEHTEPDDPGDLFGRLVDGEMDLDAPEVRRRIAQDPAFAVEVERLLALDAACSAHGAASGLEAIRSAAEPWPGADAMVRAAVRRELGPNPSRLTPRPPWRRRLPLLLSLLLLVLSLVLLGVWIANRSVDSEQLPTAPDDLVLGDPGLSPRGATPREQLLTHGFDWSALSTPPGAVFELIVVADDRQWVHEQGLRKPRWMPEEGLASLPQRIHWKVTMRAAGRAPVVWETDAWMY